MALSAERPCKSRRLLKALDLDKAKLSLGDEGPISLADICAGIGTGSLAMHVTLDRDAVPWVKKAVVEREVWCLKAIGDATDCKGTKLLLDIMADDWLVEMPACSVVIAGFPCQPFSKQGLHMGEADPRSKVVTQILLYIAQVKPRVVLLENVPGLVSESHKDLFKFIINVLRGVRGGSGRSF